MENTQLFRLNGEPDIKKIDCDQADGQNVVYWDDIQQLFPGVRYIMNDESLVKIMKDSSGRRATTDIQRQLATVMEHVSQSSHTLNTAAIMELINPRLVSTASVSTASAVADDPHFRDYIVADVDGLALTAGEIKSMVVEVLQNQQLMMDRLALIQRKAEAILVQNYELLEYTIPRLFIVPPETSTPWDPSSTLITRFRLRFICECGEHTRAAGSTIPHHLHLAKHEGYVISKPTAFFEKYGPFLMLMLEMLKFGANVAGIVVPALLSLKVVDTLDSTLTAVSSTTARIIKGVDYSLAYLEHHLRNTTCVNGDEDAEPSLQDRASYLNGVEGLEGTDLRQLGSFLSVNNADNLLGDLIRVTTDRGHVKWRQNFWKP
ncbi:hypothetical protein BGZ70_004153 [Mortierella alpina]|uniref:Uncharacterized protein n=1 Tax=Mortierella alpina TaxID=64518 RepID=A0A9P6JA30_MORAP|nr:hypothetical protein BGZ70_004153 [Mortierella alpina]